jgi:sorbitol-specific phosphotransferase system component IIA
MSYEPIKIERLSSTPLRIVNVFPGATKVIPLGPIPGVPGPKGAPGDLDSIAQLLYEHTQTQEALQWTDNHNLGRRPAAVQITSLGRKEVGAEWVHTSENQIVVLFEQPQTGYVRVM